MTLRNMADQLGKGVASSFKLVSAALARMDEPAAAHIFIRRFEDEALQQAQVADQQRRANMSPPYLGVPITVKDNFDVKGHPTTAGSLILKDAPAAERDAPVVARLRKAGFIVLGQTNMTEFAFSGLGLNPHYGTPINPAFSGEPRIPGGSSSGAAASVARGIAPAAIGTDTGGSVRIPAALCGLVGFKPTAGSVTRDGVLPLSTTLDSVGVLARSAACCVAVYEIIGDPAALPADERRLRDRPLTEIRLGVIENYVNESMDEVVAATYQRTLARLEAAGVQVLPIRLPELDEIPAINRLGTFPAIEAFAWHEKLIETHQSLYDPRVLKRIMAGVLPRAVDYVRLVEKRQRLISAINHRAAQFEALVLPTVPLIAPAMESLASDEQYNRTNMLMLRNPSVVNFLDGCAISLPCHDPGMPPVGLSLAHMAGSDFHVLALAERLQPIISVGEG